MPYIQYDQRPAYDPSIAYLCTRLRTLPTNDMVGHLTYVIFALLVRMLPKNAKFFDRAVLEEAASRAVQEYVRRHMDPYEDDAIQRNGDAT